ncbi:MAG TPA: hypothetical protein VJN02_07925 [Gammaproteobacteria bacterium]|nr:hypothetical protein [Gammaproteobacteria bacterium]
MCKANVTVDGKEISITLTKEQIEDINRQSSIITDFTQIKSYEDACKVLNINDRVEPTSTTVMIKTICRAINKLIDNNTNFPDYCNHNERKWYPYFNITSGGWVGFGGSYCHGGSSFGVVAVFKTETASNYMGETFIYLYEDLIKEKF